MPPTTENKKPLRGRPDAASSKDVRATILEVAGEYFADRGYATTSMREIAEQAGVNPAMIHYYFGNKESLLRAVLEQALEPLAHAIEVMQSEKHVSPGEILETLMSTVAAHPRLPYLVIREVMLPGGVMQAHFARHLAPRLGGALPGLLERTGGVNRELPPTVGALAIMALAIFPFVVRPVAEQVLDIRLSGDALDELKQHFSMVIERGFAA
jgi:AcrR family transcriptional regulator